MIVVTENSPLYLELYLLLKQEMVASPTERVFLIPKINAVEKMIASNVRRRLSTIASEVVIADNKLQPSNTENFSERKLYDELKLLYREAIGLADDCKNLKKIIRERKKAIKEPEGII